MNTNILTVLTSEDRDDIRVALKEIIIEQVKEDFRDNGSYLFDREDVEGMVHEALEEAKEEIKLQLKEVMLKQMQDKLGI